MQRLTADDHPCGEVRKDQDAEHDIERLDGPVARQERGRDDEQNRDDVERKQGVSEFYAAERVAFVKLPDPALQGLEWDGDGVERPMSLRTVAIKCHGQRPPRLSR